MNDDILNDDILIEDPSDDDSQKFYGGWVKDLPDHRDHKYGFMIDPLKIPSSYDMRSKFPPVYNQMKSNSCHDEYTEVLTDEGWKFFSDISLEDRLASVDPVSKKLIFENPIRTSRCMFFGTVMVRHGEIMDMDICHIHLPRIQNWRMIFGSSKAYSDRGR